MRKVLIFIFSYYFIIVYASVAQAEGNYKKHCTYINLDEKHTKTNTVQAQPLIYKNQIIAADLSGTLVSLDIQDCSENWRNKFDVPLGRRGMYLDRDNSKIYVISGSNLLTVDVITGKLLSSISVGNSVTKPIIIGKTAIVFNKHSVKLVSLNDAHIFWETDLGPSARIWSNALYIEKYKQVYFATSNPGSIVPSQNNLTEPDLSSSLVSLDTETGRLKFYFKDVFKDHWDFDVVGEPIYIENLKVNGVQYNVVIQLTKTGNMIVVDAVTGEEIIDNQTEFVELQNSMESQYVSRFQRKYNYPSAFSEIALNKDALKISDHIDKKTRHGVYEKFAIPSVDYDVILKGLHGGGEWFGAAVTQAENGDHIAVVPYNNYPWILRVEFAYVYGLIERAVYKLLYYTDQVIGYVLSDQNELTSDTNAESKFGHRWGQNEWVRSKHPTYKYRERLAYIVRPGSYNENYVKQCSGCHGRAREGDHQSESFGDGYIPSLVGYTLTKKSKKYNNFRRFEALHDNKLSITDEEYQDILSHFDNYDKKLLREKKLTKNGFWQVLLDDDGTPATKPPWGGIAIINLSNGSIENKIENYGSINEIKGSMIFGGVSEVNSVGDFAVTGSPDKTISIYNTKSGEPVFTSLLEHAGSVNPVSVRRKECEYFVQVESGGRFNWYERERGFAISIFKHGECE